MSTAPGGSRWATQGTTAASRTPTTRLLVGAGQLKGATSPSEFFNGQIDDLWIFNTALSDARIAELYNGAPILDMRFDEANGATRFADNAAYDRSGTCTGSTCPLTGEAVRGQVGLAVQFDGLNDYRRSPQLRDDEHNHRVCLGLPHRCHHLAGNGGVLQGKPAVVASYSPLKTRSPSSTSGWGARGRSQWIPAAKSRRTSGCI